MANLFSMDAFRCAFDLSSCVHVCLGLFCNALFHNIIYFPYLLLGLFF